MLLSDYYECFCVVNPFVHLIRLAVFRGSGDGFGRVGNIKMIGLGVAGRRRKACRVYAGNNFFIFNCFIKKFAAAVALLHNFNEFCHGNSPFTFAVSIIPPFCEQFKAF